MGPFPIVRRAVLAWCFALFFPLVSSVLVASHAETSEGGNPASFAPSTPQQGLIHSTPAGKSIPVSITVDDTDEIVEVRLYFKTMAAKNYLFISMTSPTKGTFAGNLPPAKNDTRGIDYILLFKNNRGESRKTKPFRLLVLNDYSIPRLSEGDFQAQTEQGTAEQTNRDFAVPLKLTPAAQPLLAEATEDPYPPLAAQGSRLSKGFTSGLGDLGGVSFSIYVGGAGFFYRGFSSH